MGPGVCCTAIREIRKTKNRATHPRPPVAHNYTRKKDAVNDILSPFIDEVNYLSSFNFSSSEESACQTDYHCNHRYHSTAQDT